jgi:hypothetical protein
MDFLPPVSPAGLTTDQLRDKVFGMMSQYYVANK